MLGVREPSIYGYTSYLDIKASIEEKCRTMGIDCEVVQSNHEGTLVDEIQRAYFEKFDGIVFNPAAYTHTSVAIADALKAVSLPCVEIHLSDPETREAFRHISYIRPHVIATVKGEGWQGYLHALDILYAHLTK